MKCSCGYQHLEDWEIDRESGWGENKELANELKARNGVEEFIRIDGNFTREDCRGDIKKVCVYACPECGALKINTDD